MAFLDHLILKEPASGKGEWTLVRQLRYAGREQQFAVPPNFKTDGASVPRVMWHLLPPFGRYLKAAVIHDYLYVTRPVSRKDADGIFRRIMREAGVSKPKRYIMWAAVRVFGWVYWKDGRAR